MKWVFSIVTPECRGFRTGRAFRAGLWLVCLVALPAHAGDRTNIPLQNWGGFAVFRDAAYDDLERLVAAGLADRTLLNTKPLSRIEAARVVARAITRIQGDEDGRYNARPDLEPVLDRLIDEFGPELASLGVKIPGGAGPAPGFFSVTPLDRATVRAGYASRDLRLLNSGGLRFQRGANGGGTFESRAQVGDFLTLYLQPEFTGNEEYGAARLLRGYGKLTLFNIELLVGRDSLWWGPGLHGSLILSNNAPPLDQIRLGTAEPFLLPWIGDAVGPTKVLFFLAELEGRRDFPYAKLAGMRGTVSPTSWLEVGLSHAVMFDGSTRPRLAEEDYPRAIFSNTAGQSGADKDRFRNNHLFALDFDLRIPNVDRYVPLARDLRFYGEFGWDDTCCDSIIPSKHALSGLMGVHLLGLFGRPGLDARFEYTRTSNETFTHSQFYRGYWTRGAVISHFVGTNGEDVYARLTNRLTSDLMLGVEVDRATVGNTLRGLSRPAERRVGGGIDVSYRFWERYSLFVQYQLAHADNRAFRAGDDGWDHLVRVELTRSFR